MRKIFFFNIKITYYRYSKYSVNFENLRKVNYLRFIMETFWALKIILLRIIP